MAWVIYLNDDSLLTCCEENDCRVSSRRRFKESGEVKYFTNEEYALAFMNENFKFEAIAPIDRHPNHPSLQRES